MKTWRRISALIPGDGDDRTSDPNIDHRRVPNLMVFFSRKGESLPISDRADDYMPGDLVTWDLGRGLTHIGMVVDRKTIFKCRYMIVHNIGEGPKMEDVLFAWKITGHYRYFGPAGGARASAVPAGKTISQSYVLLSSLGLVHRRQSGHSPR
jgi:uncharacterized protein